MVAHPLSASGGLCFSLKFRLDRFTVLEIELFSYVGILVWNCLFTPTFRWFWGHISPNDVIYRCSPQKALPCAEARRLSHKAWKSVPRFDRGAGSRKKERTGDRTVKKSQRRYISSIWREAPTERIFILKMCAVVVVPDVITCANFWAEIFRGYDFTGGRISRFPIDSFMGLKTVQRYCAACDVMLCYAIYNHKTRPIYQAA